jgi:Flp pilus assembly protein TadG
VEFALIVPILLLIVVGILNFGVVLAQQISLNNAARQAARYAVVEGVTCGDIKTEGRAAAATVGMDSAQVPIPVVTGGLGCGTDDTVKPCTGQLPGTDISVTMTRTGHSWLVTVPPFNLITVPKLEGVGVMRCEYS